MQHYREFLKDAGGWGLTSWVAALGTLVFSIYEHSHEKSVPAFWLLAATLVFFSIGAYVAWDKKREELEAERQKHTSPRFTGEIKEAHICPIVYMKGKGFELTQVSRSVDLILLLSVTGWNLADMPPASVKDYVVRVEINGETFLGKKNSGIPELKELALDLGGAVHMVSMDSVLPALEYMRAHGGYLGFYVTGLKAAGGMKANLELTLVDLDGRPHRIVAHDRQLEVGRLRCHC
jgi:hypothetical protein